VNTELLQIANFDTLTGLASRLQFQDHLKLCIAKETDVSDPFTLVFIDLDGFKLINDTLGHSVGDQLLTRVAQSLRKYVSLHSEYNGFISPLGGDEFTVILHNENDAASVGKFCEQLLGALTEPL